MSLGQQAADAPNDSRRGTASIGGEEGGTEGSEGLHLDLDFSPSDQIDSTRQANGFHTPRIFGQLVTTRGDAPNDETELEEDASLLRRQNANRPIKRRYFLPPSFYSPFLCFSLPYISFLSRRFSVCHLIYIQTTHALSRYETSLSFPLIDSFPKIFRDDNGRPLQHGTNVTTSLTTDAAVSERLKSLRSTVTRSIGLENREDLSNDLAEIAQEYHEGWSSGSDEGDDD